MSDEKHGLSDEKDVAAVDVRAATDSGAVHVKATRVDEAAEFASRFVGFEYNPEDDQRILRKIDWHILPLMMTLYLVQFMDKTTLGTSAVLGLKTDTHLSANQYNLLGTIFYVAYAVFAYPQNWALQRYPVGKWLSANISVWAIVLTCHAAATGFSGLMGLRFLLGMCESSVTAAFMLVTSMYYTKGEQARRIGYWFLMNGTAQIVSGLLAVGALHIPASSPIASWRVFYLITGGITIATAVAYWIWFPDSPLKSRWLTDAEKMHVIERIRVNQTGMETKVWKSEQMKEALLDWKLWAFFLIAAFDSECGAMYVPCLGSKNNDGEASQGIGNACSFDRHDLSSHAIQIPNSLTNQSSLIIKSLGFTSQQTVLLGTVSGAIEILTIYSSTLCLKRWPNQRFMIAAIYIIPNIVGAAVIIGLPFSQGTAILLMVYLTGVGTPLFVIQLALVSSCVSGYTKRITFNAMFLIGYCLGNLLAPLMWKAEYAPKYNVPWSIILVSYAICGVATIVMRQLLKRENARRDALQAEMGVDVGEDKYGYIDELQEDGTVETKRVDKTFLDLTDKDPSNLSFRYPQ